MKKISTFEPALLSSKESTEQTITLSDRQRGKLEEEEININDLPNELLFEIFTYAVTSKIDDVPGDPTIISVLLRVSRRFKAIAEEGIFKRLTLKTIFWERSDLEPSSLEGFNIFCKAVSSANFRFFIHQCRKFKQIEEEVNTSLDERANTLRDAHDSVSEKESLLSDLHCCMISPAILMALFFAIAGGFLYKPNSQSQRKAGYISLAGGGVASAWFAIILYKYLSASRAQSAANRDIESGPNPAGISQELSDVVRNMPRLFKTMNELLRKDESSQKSAEWIAGKMTKQFSEMITLFRGIKKDAPETNCDIGRSSDQDETDPLLPAGAASSNYRTTGQTSYRAEVANTFGSIN